jgi:hypothetical protein
MRPRKNTVIHTTGTCTGTHACNMTVGGRGGRTGIIGTMYTVPTGMEGDCTATVVAQWQWQVGATKNELMLWHMAFDDSSSLSAGVGVCRWVVGVWVCSVLLWT